MKDQLDLIINNLTETFEGMPWHGLPLRDILEGVDVKTAFWRPFPNKHNIAELVAHILIWRQFVLEILDENYDYQLDIGALQDFPEVAETESVWKELLTQLSENQAELVKKISAFHPGKLDDEVPSKPFSYRYLFDGIIHHDLYHGGQIALIKAVFQAPQDNIEISRKAFDFKTILK
jgi:hypothetical protein